MTLSKTLGAMLAAAVALPASAQDIPSPYQDAVAQHGQMQLDATLMKRRLQQARERRSTAAPLSPKARATCEDRKRIAAGLPAAKAKQLYALCAQAGY